MNRWIRSAAILITLFACTTLTFGKEFPERPSPPRMVNDYTQTLSVKESMNLENKLVHFNDETSTQIVVVLLPTLHGYEKADYSVRLAEKWGIGQKGKDNGILILVKPKTASARGEAYIAVGYGLEGAVPDIVAKRIIENEMIPYFKQGLYYGGINQATNVIMDLTRNEYTADQYMKESRSGSGAGFLLGLIFFVVIIRAFLRPRSNYYSTRSSNLPLWAMLFGMGASNSYHRGSYNSFSSGTGGFGGGSSFGGFGGGSFGGGGAGGSW